MNRRVIFEYIFVTLFFLFLIAIFTYPAVLHLSNKLIGDGGDSYQFLSYQYIAFKNIQNGLSPLSWSNIFRYPQGFDFSRNDGLYTTFTGAILNFVMTSIPAYNITILSVIFLNLIISYIFFKKIAHSRLIGLIGAIFYGYSFYVAARAAGHANLVLVAGFPLLFYSVLSFKEKPTLFNASLIPLSVILVSIGSVQYLLYLLIAFFIFFPITLLIFPRQTYATIKLFILHKKKLFVAFIGFISVFIFLYYPYLNSLFLKRNFVMPNSKLQFFDLKPEVLDYFLPNSFLPLLINGLLKNPHLPKVDKVVFLGFLELILFLFFLFWHKENRLRLYIVLSFLLYLLFPHFLYPFLYNQFPFSTTAEIGRYYVIYYLFFSTGIVLLLSQLQWKYKKTFFILILTLLILERLPTNYYLSNPQEETKIFNIIKQLDGEGLLILPISNWYAKYNLFPIFTNKKLVEGYVHWSTNDQRANEFMKKCGEMGRFDLESEKLPFQYFFNPISAARENYLNSRMIDCLKKNDIRVIVFDKYYRVYWDDYRHLLARTTLLFPHISTIRQTQGVTKLEATRWAANKFWYSLYFPKSGTFRIYNIHYANPSKQSIMTMKLNGREINTRDWPSSLNFEWNRWTRRIYPINSGLDIQIPSGGRIDLASNEFTNGDGFFNILYSFNEYKNGPTINPPPSVLEKVYEDEKIEVWKIN